MIYTTSFSKIIGLLFVPLLTFAHDYTQLMALISDSPQLKSAQQSTLAAKNKMDAIDAKHYPTIDAHLSAIRWHEIPSVTFYVPTAQTVPMGTQNHVEGSITLTYPLFTGFALSSHSDIASLEHEKAILDTLNLKRNLYLEATHIYTTILSLDESIIAYKDALAAMEKSYLKAKGFYDHGLLAPSELYAIEAKKFALQSQLNTAMSNKQQHLNQLSYLTHSTIETLTPSNSVIQEPSLESILQHALNGREDLKALQIVLKLSKDDIALSQSTLYPHISLLASLAGQGDTLALNGDGYTNSDKSYAGAIASWNLFNGGGDYYTQQAARANYLAAQLNYDDYKAKITTEITNAHLQLTTLKNIQTSAQMEVKSFQEYANLAQGRFNNQLTSADELSRAIADLSHAQANLGKINGDIFNQTAMLYLLGGLDMYEKEVLKIK